MAARQRKVYFATSLDDTERDSKLKLIAERFRFTSDADEAEFVVLDLTHPPANWSNYTIRRDEPCLDVRPGAIVPCLLFCHEGQKSVEMPSILGQVRANFRIEPRICETVVELHDNLKWLECMFPLRRVTRAELRETGVRDLLGLATLLMREGK
jgi:hypothetical protein